MPVGARHPYAGELVFTAFSGSHQDAINKGMAKYNERKNKYWEVPYLPVDPRDLGREYEALVRINSQSGKGGIAFVMDKYYGYKLPKSMHKEFADIIQKISEKTGEVSPQTIMNKFEEEYLTKESPFKLIKFRVKDLDDDQANTKVVIRFMYNNEEKVIEGVGNGPIDSLRNAINDSKIVNIHIIDYNEHSLGKGSEAKAAAYVNIQRDDTKQLTFGVGVDSNITLASIKAIFSALNRLY